MNKLDVQNAILNAMTPYLDDDQLYQLKNTLIEQLYGMNIVEEETRLSVGKRTKICVKKNENLCQKFCAATIRDITDEDVAKLEEHISIVEKLATNASELEHQCLYFAKGELARQKEKDYSKAMELYMKAIHITLPDFDGKKPLRNNLLTFDEIMIINSIAILYSNDERNIMDAIHLDLWLKEYMENRIVDGRMKTAKYPMILYNLSCWFGDKNCHKEALKMADEGVNFCIQYGNLAFFPILLFNEGGTLVELGEIDKGKEHLHQAITIFKAMRRKDMVQTAIEWCKIHYQIDF